MKEIILKVPDHKVDFVMELIEQLSLELHSETDIPDEHKEIVRSRIKKSTKKPQRLLDWNEVENSFKMK